MINIEELIPFMKKGWVAMDENGLWYWYEAEPKRGFGYWHNSEEGCAWDLEPFDIAPVEDWETSLRKVG